ncbi:CobW family GTP-binding protein [Paenibacillus chitinolyticus]|uniref:CobW family GTP-binding protein n=1 Tax=Paenibacillus chitinolyticus TaxID=79263 RepID=UPI003625E32D
MTIPVFVLSGFLGSGKTTLLLRMLEESKELGLRPGILMNELGKADVDGLILEGHSSASIEKLLDGCVCCSKKSELTGSLQALLVRKPDILFIELTGVANPEEIADVLTEPGLLGRVALKQVITVLDAENFMDYNSLFASDKQLVRTLRRQVEVADLILVNKTDYVHRIRLHQIEKAIRKLNGHAMLVYTTHCRVELKPILEGVQPAQNGPLTVRPIRLTKIRTHPKEPSAAGTGRGMQPADSPAPAETAPSHSRVRTVTLPWNQAAGLTKADVDAFLQRWKDGLIRAKGYVTFAESSHMHLLQYAGKRSYWEPSFYQGEPYLVFIGIDLDTDRLSEEWQRLQDTPQPQSLEPESGRRRK